MYYKCNGTSFNDESQPISKGKQKSPSMYYYNFFQKISNGSLYKLTAIYTIELAQIGATIQLFSINIS